MSQPTSPEELQQIAATNLLVMEVARISSHIPPEKAPDPADNVYPSTELVEFHLFGLPLLLFPPLLAKIPCHTKQHLIPPAMLPLVEGHYPLPSLRQLYLYIELPCFMHSSSLNHSLASIYLTSKKWLPNKLPSGKDLYFTLKMSRYNRCTSCVRISISLDFA